MSGWEAVCGLEVHAQLATRTKLFCGCAVRFGAPPNAQTCPVCSGQPGVLPVLNREAFELAVRAALALGCDVAPWSKFDRKNYFYCDLPKGYQISQYDRPYATGGGIALSCGRFVRLTRIHVEEDAGKAVHDRGPHTLVDLNRAGVPLIESVTEADITSADEAVEYLTALKETLEFAGVSGCDMEKGELRCDVNVSVRRPGEPLRTKVEIKNLNSFRFVKAAFEHEVARQIEAYESGDASRFPVQETRLFDPERGVTRTMRVKESEDDYRYIAEPAHVPVTVDAAFLERQRGFLPEPPAARRARYTSTLGLSEYDAGVLTQSRATADWFEALVRVGAPAKEAANWITNELLAALADPEVEAHSIDELTLRPHDLAELIGLVEAGKVQRNAARTVLRAMLSSGRPAGELVRELGLAAVTDTAAIEGWCRAALAEAPQVIEQVRAGNAKALGALIGPVMKLSSGKADPKLVRETLERLIAGGA
jgi:aspartyl-tRNA(Asn)/glutamyl-tRNA(Gln) amidotransferase subunit B